MILGVEMLPEILRLGWIHIAYLNIKVLEIVQSHCPSKYYGRNEEVMP